MAVMAISDARFYCQQTDSWASATALLRYILGLYHCGRS